MGEQFRFCGNSCLLKPNHHYIDSPLISNVLQRADTMHDMGDWTGMVLCHTTGRNMNIIPLGYAMPPFGKPMHPGDILVGKQWGNLVST